MKNRNIIVIFISIIVLTGGSIWFFTNTKQSTRTPTAVSSQQQVAINRSAPEATFINLQGTSVKLSSFKGKKVMLWLVATWCSSCAQGAKVLSQNKSKLNGLTIITLKTYGNAGYPGPGIKEFISQVAPNMFLSKNWSFGDITKQSTKVYNPRNYPDIYFLIDKNGIVRVISDAPAATLGTILKFAHN